MTLMITEVAVGLVDSYPEGCSYAGCCYHYGDYYGGYGD